MDTPTPEDVIGFAITVRGQRYEVLGTSIDAEDEYAFEMETGRNLQDFMTGDLNQVRMAVMWWLARRHAGEQRLTVAACVKGFPKPIEMQAAVATDGDDQTLFVLEELLSDSEGSSPEGSGGTSESTGPNSPASTASTPGTSAAPLGSPEPKPSSTATP